MVPIFTSLTASSCGASRYSAGITFVERTVYEPNADGRGGHYVKKMIKKRLVNKQYLIVGRGAAKSIYDSCIQSFFENVDTSTTHQITTAPTMKLAEEVMSPIRTAITRARGPVFQFLTQGSLQNTTGSQGQSRQVGLDQEKGIENFLTGSLIEIRPMSINKLQGLRCKIATVDEWLSGDIREDVIGAIEQGASKVDDYLIVATSSEGTVRNGAGDTIKMELMSILKGDYPNPHVSIWWYKLDSVDEVGYPEMWMKANPNIGKTVSYETYQLDVERAEKRLPQGMIFLPSVSDCRWRVIPITSPTKRHCRIANAITGRWLARLVETFLRVTTSVRSPFCSRCVTVPLV